MSKGSPLALWGDEVVQSEFAIDLLQPEVDGVVVELGLRYTVGGDRSGEPRKLGLGLTPTATSLTRGIGIS